MSWVALVEIIVEDVLRRGPDVRLEVAVVPGLDPTALREIEGGLAPLARKGIRVIYRRVRRPPIVRQPDAA